MDMVLFAVVGVVLLALLFDFTTTQAAAASVMGGGAASGSGLNFRKIGEMLTAWIFTLPAAAIVGFVAFTLTTFPDPWGWIASLSAIAVLGVWAGRLTLNATDADDVAEMLPSETELHEYHTVPHPDVHQFEGPEHVNHHELEHGHEDAAAAKPTEEPEQPHV